MIDSQAATSSGRRPAVRAGDDGDGVLTVVLDADQGDTARAVRETTDVPGLHPAGGQGVQQRVTERIAADAADQAAPGAQPGGGHGLIRALAAGTFPEVPADDGLAGTRELPHPHDEIQVDRADDHHVGRPGVGGGSRVVLRIIRGHAVTWS